MYVGVKLLLVLICIQPRDAAETLKIKRSNSSLVHGLLTLVGWSTLSAKLPSMVGIRDKQGRYFHLHSLSHLSYLI
jgi:hypothetical protein